MKSSSGSSPRNRNDGDEFADLNEKEIMRVISQIKYYTKKAYEHGWMDCAEYYENKSRFVKKK